MEKDVRFEIVLVGPQLRGESSGIPEIYVQVVTGDKAPFYMRENNFMNRCVKLPLTIIIHFLLGVSNSIKGFLPQFKGIPIDRYFRPWALFLNNFFIFLLGIW